MNSQHFPSDFRIFVPAPDRRIIFVPLMLLKILLAMGYVSTYILLLISSAVHERNYWCKCTEVPQATLGKAVGRGIFKPGDPCAFHPMFSQMNEGGEG